MAPFLTAVTVALFVTRCYCGPRRRPLARVRSRLGLGLRLVVG